MGRDKAAVVVAGVPMRARVLRALRAVCDEVVQLGGPTGDAEVVVPDDGAGPFLAVIDLLARVPGDRFVIAPVDQPLLSPGLLRRLLDVDVGVAGGVCFDGEPLPCVLAAGARDRVALLAAAGERRMRTLATTSIAPTDHERSSLMNVNSPADAAAAEAALADQRSP
jgi:molybdopterin-guanine dinucleotide biosynthesis protein A